IGDLGKDVWHKIGGSSVGAIIELRANGSKLRGKRDVTADILIRIFNANSHGPVFVGVIGDTKLGGASVRHSHSKVLILVVSNCEIRGHGSDARAIRSQPTPCLPSKKFPFASF